MKKFNCPACAAELIFQANTAVYAVCRYCGNMVVRHDLAVESIGTMAELPEDMSPLQIGTDGVYRGQAFQVLGRLKIAWAQGTWNEWFIQFDNGKTGWLAEAQGFYAISHELDEGLPQDTKVILNNLIHLNTRQKFKLNTPEALEKPKHEPLLGTYLTLNHQQFKVMDIKQAVCVGSEGELPFSAQQGRRTTTLDLLGALGEFASIEVEQQSIRVYLGHYVEWNDLQFNHTRPLEGWA